MATRRKPRRKAPARKRRRRAPARRRASARRRRNPKINVKGALAAGAGGLVAAAGAYALEGADLKPLPRAGILAGVGIVAGVLAMSFNPRIGAGLIGGGVALGGKVAIDHYQAQQAQTTEAVQANLGRIPAYAVRKFGRTPDGRTYRHLPQARQHLSAVEANLGAVEQAELHMY